ncbi:MAG: glutathione S-transferase family protein [Pseudomonadota bacterium]
MLTLHGRTRSNYYNAVKTVLIEKGLEFEEVKEPVPPTPEYLSLSPMAKVPCLVTEHGALTETASILDYLEDVYPQVPLRPTDPFLRAKFNEVNKALELYVEWVARRGYGVLRGEETSQHEKADVVKGLTQAVDAIPKLTSFDPWVFGDSFTYADIFGYFMLVYARHSARIHAEIDLLDALGAQTWFEKIEQRESVQRVLEDAAAYTP